MNYFLLLICLKDLKNVANLFSNVLKTGGDIKNVHLIKIIVYKIFPYTSSFTGITAIKRFHE